MDDNSASEFLTSNQNAALALYFLLKKEDRNPVHTSGLVKHERTKKDFHIHRVYVPLPLEILNTYVEHEADRFASMFVRARWMTQKCPVELTAGRFKKLPERLYWLCLG